MYAHEFIQVCMPMNSLAYILVVSPTVDPIRIFMITSVHLPSPMRRSVNSTYCLCRWCGARTRTRRGPASTDCGHTATCRGCRGEKPFQAVSTSSSPTPSMSHRGIFNQIHPSLFPVAGALDVATPPPAARSRFKPLQGAGALDAGCHDR